MLCLLCLGAAKAQAQAQSDSNLREVPVRIMGSGKLTADELSTFFALLFPNGEHLEQAERLAPLYIAEAQVEGVNHDIAFAQMILETGFLQFKGLVSPRMNNFCGLGAVNAARAGNTFPDERIGIRAHIQHLKAYASTQPLVGELADPRYRFVNPKGKAPTVDALVGTWAQDPRYAAKIKSILHRMYASTYAD
ncbi:MAG: glucosaminidase domain-containing protein [Prevotellaceae bacterium]|nr:glucosaminidase domain-containing protein [Prevotellaceae bacterium]